MHILYVLPELPPSFGGGIATVYERLLPRLVEEGISATVLLSSRESLDAPKYQWQGVDVIPLQSWALLKAEVELNGWRQNAFIHQFLPMAWAAWIQAQELGPFDLIEATDWALLFIPWVVQKRRQPVIVSLHGSCGQVDWHGNPRARGGEGQLVRLLEAAALPLADAVIANSTLNAEFWWQQCGVRAEVIPPVVDLAATAPALGASGIHLGSPRSGRGVVVGRLQNWKGPEVLCNALRLLPGQQVDWIGQDTAWEESTISTAEHLRRQFPDVVDQQLHLLGKLPPHQVRDHISQAAFLCVPSFFDVFNITILESIAVRTPVICSRQAGASMLLQQQVAGYLFDSDHPAQLAEAIQALQECSALQKGEMCQAAINQSIFSCEASIVVKQTTNLYLHTIQNWQPRGDEFWLETVITKGLHGALPRVSMRPSNWSIRLPMFIKKCLFMIVAMFHKPKARTTQR